MADDDKDLADGNGKKGGRGGLVIILVSVLVASLVAGGGTFAALYFTGVIGGKADHAAEDAGEAQEDEGGEEAEAEEEAPPIYIALDPFVVNFDNPTVARFLQVKLQVMTRSPETAKAIEEHMPVIRNALVMLFSGQKYEDVATREGKERLRQRTLAEIRKVLEERTGDPGVEDVYFTAFVMQ